jgi:hypothetical protein
VNTLEFIANLVASLAWPIAVFGAVVLLRKPLSTLINTLRGVRFGDVEVAFDQGLREAERKLDRSKLEPARVEPSKIAQKVHIVSNYEEFIELLAATSPHAAVLDSWRRVERTIDYYFKQRNLERPHAFSRVRQMLSEDPNVDSTILEILDDLRVLRNEVAHHEKADFRPQQAIEYGQLAQTVISILFEAAEMAPAPQ